MKEMPGGWDELPLVVGPLLLIVDGGTIEQVRHEAREFVVVLRHEVGHLPNAQGEEVVVERASVQHDCAPRICDGVEEALLRQVIRRECHCPRLAEEYSHGLKSLCLAYSGWTDEDHKEIGEQGVPPKRGPHPALCGCTDRVEDGPQPEDPGCREVLAVLKKQVY